MMNPSGTPSSSDSPGRKADRPSSGYGPTASAGDTNRYPRPTATMTVYDEGDEATGPSADEIEQADAKWEASLTRVLSLLDSLRDSLEVAIDQRDPVGAVRVAATITHQVADFIALRVPGPDNKPSQAVTEALSSASRFLIASQALTAKTSSNWFQGWLGTKRTLEPAVVQEALAVLYELPLVLERYFTLLGSRFQSSTRRVDWIATSAMFLSDLNQTLQRVHGTPDRAG